ncbi:MAG TPA: 4-hydroxy-3-methylbut-2-enyl diphosphate reductase [Ignavibacteria bacterium]|nr:4-hydroxy-3-methylbut-2-enyl diphosphate reductase [Bacteroidota bacterium]HRE12017.1 4-hydroxy-3-methylbut-2-enyl diphosphate reductase [Ignavibacteria bacterium]HRF65448.1 4-hydroxy-3-methylbut-2-enyl diphosphate reductase [Ignavibacteria bacterium]HRJ04551.1 4-hydroxy-3-methylbut-2-enyl diphosphate reductase [Ignavibacteria bacterium]HRJ85342.1 4-hydroxy-3-methylbut-2-enyl diphosphate reductase [Ignavibacteria bacterium]
MKKFDIPIYYRSPVISVVKNARKITDPRKKDYTPSVLDFGPVKFLIARHFGFCYGVENAIEIAYKSLEQNPGKRVFLLSEMIHNPSVNSDLSQRGVRFLREHNGKQLIPWEELNSDDIVIVPAFGTTLEIQELLANRGIDPYKYDTTCPFVEKVWNRAEALGKKSYTIIVHGKYNHEETIATFSHSKQNSPTLIVRNIEETKMLRNIILGKIPADEFYTLFEGKYSDGFDVVRDLDHVGVVNQTTMLATETQAIADMIRTAMAEKYGDEKIKEHFADTSDTLCYATYDNQQATLGLLNSNADFAIVVGGYNSSNTSHIVELCEEKLPVYFVSGAEKIISEDAISHFNIHTSEEVMTENWLKRSMAKPVEIILTSGASCPDAILDEVLQKIVAFFPGAQSIENALLPFKIDTLN